MIYYYSQQNDRRIVNGQWFIERAPATVETIWNMVLIHTIIKMPRCRNPLLMYRKVYALAVRRCSTDSVSTVLCDQLLVRTLRDDDSSHCSRGVVRAEGSRKRNQLTL